MGILGHFGTYWDILGHIRTVWDNSEDFLTSLGHSNHFMQFNYPTAPREREGKIRKKWWERRQLRNELLKMRKRKYSSCKKMMRDEWLKRKMRKIKSLDFPPSRTFLHIVCNFCFFRNKFIHSFKRNCLEEN